jgi:DNA-binding MarR family transcriptional regulator
MSRPPARPNVTAGTAPDLSRTLDATTATFGLGMKRWIRSNLPTGQGLTVPRATLLGALATMDEPVGMSELAEFLAMSPRNMTVLVDGLEKQGLVDRVPHRRDRRVTVVAMTEAGRQLARTALGPSQVATAKLFHDLTPHDQAELLRLLRQLLDSLRDRGIDMPNGGEREIASSG